MNKYDSLYTQKYYYPDKLYHHGILGQKWGVRRYQNPDGTLTLLGKERYRSVSDNVENGKVLLKTTAKQGAIMLVNAIRNTPASNLIAQGANKVGKELIKHGGKSLLSLQNTGRSIELIKLGSKIMMNSTQIGTIAYSAILAGSIAFGAYKIGKSIYDSRKKHQTNS